MPRKYKVYLDTSVLSALYDNRNPERQEMTKEFFVRLGDFDAYISSLTMEEIQNTRDNRLKELLFRSALLFKLVENENDVQWLVNQYIMYGAVPDTYVEDAYHIALAVINEMDFLLSWNFKHLVKKKTRDSVDYVNSKFNLKKIEIVTPTELL